MCRKYKWTHTKQWEWNGIKSLLSSKIPGIDILTTAVYKTLKEQLNALMSKQF